MLECKFCKKIKKNSISLKAHESKCPLNLQRKYANGMLGKKGKNQYIKAKELGLPKIIHTQLASGAAIATKEQKSLWAKKAGTGGYKRNSGKGLKSIVKDSFGKETHLQSTYELECSKILNSMGIRWIRPKFLKYDDRKYFPDFYLIDYEIYLDPKNDYLARIDKEKIEKVCKQNNVLVYILTKNLITEEYLKRIVETERPTLAPFD